MFKSTFYTIFLFRMNINYTKNIFFFNFKSKRKGPQIGAFIKKSGVKDQNK